MNRVLALSARIYGRLLDFYPEDLCRDYGAEMALAFAEDLEVARRQAGARGVVRVWWCVLVEFLRFALPGCVSRPAVRVNAMALVLFITMMAGWMPGSPGGFSAVRAAFVLPLFSPPLIFLVSAWYLRER